MRELFQLLFLMKLTFPKHSRKVLFVKFQLMHMNEIQKQEINVLHVMVVVVIFVALILKKHME